MSAAEVYIANVVKCRPPGNRDPEAIEIETCTPFLREQIRLIEPDVLVTLGNFATKFVLKTETGITRLHGTVRQAGRFKVLPIFHPAAAIYDRTKRDDLFGDFERLGQLLAERTRTRARARTSGPAPNISRRQTRAHASPASSFGACEAGASEEASGSAEPGEQQRLF